MERFLSEAYIWLLRVVVFLHSGINNSIDNVDNIKMPQNILFLLPNSVVQFYKDVLI